MKEKELKTAEIKIRVEPGTKEGLKKIAKANRRTFSNYLRVVLEDLIELEKEKLNINEVKDGK